MRCLPQEGAKTVQTESFSQEPKSKMFNTNYTKVSNILHFLFGFKIIVGEKGSNSKYWSILVEVYESKDVLVFLFVSECREYLFKICSILS